MGSLPNRPLRVDEFLRFAGWTGADVLHPDRIATALAYFQAEIPCNELRRRVNNPGFWMLPHGNVIKLCEFMQSIDYTKPVLRETLPRYSLLKAYKNRESLGRLGNYFTDLGVDMNTLAIPRDQQDREYYHVNSPAPALRCTASDALVHWAESRGVPIEYRHGGGKQYIIANAGRHLKLIE